MPQKASKALRLGIHCLASQYDTNAFSLSTADTNTHTLPLYAAPKHRFAFHKSLSNAIKNVIENFAGNCSIYALFFHSTSIFDFESCKIEMNGAQVECVHWHSPWCRSTLSAPNLPCVFLLFNRCLLSKRVAKNPGDLIDNRKLSQKIQSYLSECDIYVLRAPVLFYFFPVLSQWFVVWFRFFACLCVLVSSVFQLT